MILYGLCMVYVWIIYGLCMDYVWISHALCMDNVWIMYGINSWEINSKLELIPGKSVPDCNFPAQGPQSGDDLGPRRASTRHQREPKRDPGYPKGTPGQPKGAPRVDKETPKGCQGPTQGAQRGPNGYPRLKGHPKSPKESHRKQEVIKNICSQTAAE